MAPVLFPSIKLVAGDSAMHSTLSRGESIGLAFRTESGLLSAVAASVILILNFRRVYIDRRWLPMDIYVIALFAAEVIQGIANTISMKWVIEGEVNVGTTCTAQGLLGHMGVLGVSLATLAIAVQTFVSIWWLKYPTITIASVSVGVQWLFIILWAAIGFGVHTHPPSTYYATPTPYWCWIGRNFKAQRLAGEYIWLWLTLCVSIALYPLLFLLHLRVIKPGERWYAPTTEGPKRSRGGPSRLWTAIVYPIVYCVVVLPWSIIRWIGFRQQAIYGEIRIPPVVIFIFANLFALGGALNAAVYLLTRSSLFFPEKKDELNAPVSTAPPDNPAATTSNGTGDATVTTTDN